MGSRVVWILWKIQKILPLPWMGPGILVSRSPVTIPTELTRPLCLYWTSARRYCHVTFVKSPLFSLVTGPPEFLLAWCQKNALYPLQWLEIRLSEKFGLTNSLAIWTTVKCPDCDILGAGSTVHSCIRFGETFCFHLHSLNHFNSKDRGSCQNLRSATWPYSVPDALARISVWGCRA